MPEDRRLAAIMFTDIVGYTALMGESEKKAFETINANREIHKRHTEKHHGKIVKELGDGLLTVFENGTEAVVCAIAIQKESREKNIPLRIGIHEGEVVFRDGDVFGDGVNIASRIQAEAVPGGVCISDTVYRIIKNKEDIKAESIGKKSLKNVKESLNLYQLNAPGLQIRKKNDTQKLNWWITPIIGLIFLIIGYLIHIIFYQQVPSEKIQRFTINIPEEAPVAMIGEAHFRIGQKAIAISPDGNLLVFVGEANGTTLLYTRSLNSYEVVPLSGTEGAYFPFFSPDGKWLAFFTSNHLKKLNFQGDDPIVLCNVMHPYGGTWAGNDILYFVDEEGDALSYISSEGGRKKDLIRGKLSNFNNPHALPDNEHILFNTVEHKIFVVSSKSGEITHITDEGHDPRYIEPGFLVYNRRDRIMAVSFNSEKLLIKGKPFTIHDNVRIEGMSYSSQFTFSKTGTFLFIKGGSVDVGELVWVNHQGKIVDKLPFTPNYFGPYRISPDGKKLAYTVYEDLKRSRDFANLYVVDLSRNIPNLIDEEANMFGIWYPDSKSLAYLKKNAQGFLDIYKRTLNSEKSEILYSLAFTDGIINQISQDNKYLYANFYSGSNTDCYLLNLIQMDTIKLTTDPTSDQFGPTLSTNGDYLIYGSTETGQYDLFCIPNPPTGEKWRITKNGAESYQLSQADNKIYYRSIDTRKMMVVKLNLENGFDFDEPQLLWEGDFLDIPGPSFDVSPDGKYFLMKKSVVEKHTTIQINVITNFFKEVKQKAAEQ